MYSPFHLYLYRYDDLYMLASHSGTIISVTFYYNIYERKHHPLPVAFPGILVCFYNYQQDYQQGFSLTAASSDAFFFNSHILNMNRPIHTESGRRETGLGLFCLPVVVVSGRRKAGLGLFVCLFKLLAADIFRKILYSSACSNFWRQTFPGKSYICLPV